MFYKKSVVTDLGDVTQWTEKNRLRKISSRSRIHSPMCLWNDPLTMVFKMSLFLTVLIKCFLRHS